MQHILYSIIMLSVLFISNFAWAQTPSCRCDTLDAEGITGDEIIEQLCPGGELIDGASFVLNDEVVSVSSDLLSYEVITSSSGCFVDNNGDRGGIVDLSPENFLDCRERLIMGCNKIIARDVPTLSQWGLIAMAGGLGIIGFMVIRRRKVAS